MLKGTQLFHAYMGKQTFSMDVKPLRKNSTYFSSFSKKKKNDSRIIYRNQTPTNIMANTPKKQLFQKKRRLSLNKQSQIMTKGNQILHSVSVDQHMLLEKQERARRLIHQKKYQQAANTIKQIISHPHSFHHKQQSLQMLVYCERQLGNLKQQEHFLTKYLNQFGQNYDFMLERGIVRLKLGAKELALRDFKSATFINSKKSQAYEAISEWYLLLKKNKEACQALKEGIKKSNNPLNLKIRLIQLLLTDTTYNEEQSQKIQILIEGLAKLLEENQEKQKRRGDIFFLEGKLLQYKGHLQEACICYEEALKYNSSENSVTKAMERILVIKISERDYYEAYHTVKRRQLLNVNSNVIEPYGNFLEGVIMLMKKKFSDGVQILEKIFTFFEKEGKIKKLITQSYRSLIEPLLYKKLAYGYFKLGKHEKVIFYYKKLKPFGYDESSSYNLLLAEGIVAVEKHENYQVGIEKFQQTKFIYPNKVQPYLYIAMAIIYRAVNKLNENNQNEFISAVLHALEELNEAHEDILDSSSNLLYHRAIIQFYLLNWEAALDDINKCIEKAQENLPKYFYLRGMNYAVLHNFHKAINEYCISLSLSQDYIQSLLERAKCYFLIGDTENGFLDLKKYLTVNSKDYHVHEWIGNLLYEGRSYTDALRAYDQVEEECLKVYEMKAKCFMRVGKLQNVRENIVRMSKLANYSADILEVDFLALNILQSLNKQNWKEVSKEIKQLNLFLEESRTGYVFKLIDCMNLLSLGMFYMGRFEDAYQSLLLVLELFSTLSQKNKSELRSDTSEEIYSLQVDEIFSNIFICMVGMKDFEKAIKLLKEEYCGMATEDSLLRNALKIVQKYEKESQENYCFNFPSSVRKNENIKLKFVQFKIKNIKIKCKYVFSLFHENADNLYSGQVAKKMILDLKPSYIDNMPEGPWIKRNEHGVIFTGNILQGQQTSTLLSTAKNKNEEKESSESYESESEEEMSRRRVEFKKMMKLDPKIENKINSFLNSK